MNEEVLAWLREAVVPRALGGPPMAHEAREIIRAAGWRDPIDGRRERRQKADAAKKAGEKHAARGMRTMAMVLSVFTDLPESRQEKPQSRETIDAVVAGVAAKFNRVVSPGVVSRHVRDFLRFASEAEEGAQPPVT